MDMIERAAAELVSTCEDAGCVGPEGAAQHLARAALHAALDPDDTALIERVARVLHGEMYAHSQSGVVAVIAALRTAMAQGEPR